jgi:hypothetical protein
MNPRLIPKAVFNTLATGARQFVVQDALDTIKSSPVNVSLFTP